MSFHSVPCAGSFIRSSRAVSYGLSFCEALVSKYTELPHSSSVEKVILGSSNGTIEVEAVGLNKIRANLSRLETLREVSLDDECISRPDAPGKIHATCPGKCLLVMVVLGGRVVRCLLILSSRLGIKDSASYMLPPRYRDCIENSRVITGIVLQIADNHC